MSREREPIILVHSGRASALGNTLRQRYVEGYRVVVLEGETADPLAQLHSYRAANEQIALLIDEHAPSDFLEQSNHLYPNGRRLLIADAPEAEASLGLLNRHTIDYLLVRPWSPPETKLYPIIDELLAEWRATVGMPFMQVRGIMTVRAVRIRLDDTLHRAAEIIALSGVGDLMVIDDDNNFVGVLSVGDVLRAAMPDTAEIMSEGGTLEQAFRLFLRKGSELMYKPVAPLVIRHPLVVDPDDHVAKVAALMLEKNIHRLPVVKDGRLLGTVGRTDVCQAVVGTL